MEAVGGLLIIVLVLGCVVWAIYRMVSGKDYSHEKGYGDGRVRDDGGGPDSSF